MKNETIREIIYQSYSNLAMAHSAVEKKQENYASFNFMIRAKLLKGLTNGTMNIRSIFDDEKIKLQSGKICNYCGSPKNLALDHIFPVKHGGKDDAENLRNYLLSGGFLHIDDNYGMQPYIVKELKKVFPNKELIEIPKIHQIFNIFYFFI